MVLTVGRVLIIVALILAVILAAMGQVPWAVAGLFVLLAVGILVG